MHLLYITDVFCPWCYGFIPVMRRLSRDHPSLPVRVLGGNLVESPQRISEMLEEHPALPAFFERLEQTTGQTTARFRELGVARLRAFPPSGQACFPGCKAPGPT